MTDRCKSCHKPIVWLKTSGGRYMPTDASSVHEPADTFDASKGHVSHFATCPNAKRWRKEPQTR